MPGITSRLERLRAIPVEAIREYRQTKTSALIPADLQPHILQLDTVARMTHTRHPQHLIIFHTVPAAKYSAHTRPFP